MTRDYPRKYAAFHPAVENQVRRYPDQWLWLHRTLENTAAEESRHYPIDPADPYGCELQTWKPRNNDEETQIMTRTAKNSQKYLACTLEGDGTVPLSGRGNARLRRATD